MTDVAPASPALRYFLNKPVNGNVLAGAKAVQFELIVSAHNTPPICVDKIQIQIPCGLGSDSLAISTSLVIGDLPSGWSFTNYVVLNRILLDLEHPNGVEISQLNPAGFRFSIDISSLPGASTLCIAESFLRDGQFAFGAASTEITINKHDHLPFSITSFSCSPELFVPGEQLQLQFQISGELPAGKLPFRIDYTDNQGNLQPLSRLYIPNTEPNGFTFQQGLITVPLPSSDLNKHIGTSFKLYYATTDSGQVRFKPVEGRANASPLNIFKFINPAPSSEPLNLGALTFGEKILLKWRYDIPPRSDLKPRLSIVQTLLSINGGESRPIQPKLVDDGYQFEVDSLALWPPTATASSPAACKASLQLIAELENPSYGTPFYAKSGLLEVHAYQFQDTKTASISRSAGTAWVKRDSLVEPAPIGFLEHLSDNAALSMIWIPAGEFIMGSSPQEPYPIKETSPQHHVTLAGFFLGQTPVTQTQWISLMNSNPSQFREDTRPVESVKWSDAMEFCNRLSQCTRRQYTLPSEAQWEYACRGSTTTPFHFGETISPELVNYTADTSYDDGPTGQFPGTTTPVRSYPANAWGLHDMHGNIWEWCLDVWQRDSSFQIARGGSWVDRPWTCRSAHHYNFRPNTAKEYLGFRVVCLLSKGLDVGF